MNNEDVFGQLTFNPHPKWTIRSEAHSLNLVSAQDLWYIGGGAFQKQTFGYTGRPSGGQKGFADIFDVHLPAGATLPNPAAGLLVDAWVEPVPNPQETAGIAFHLERPTSQPPQTCLVAVPPDRIPETADEERWLGAIAALERGDSRAARTAYGKFLERWPQNSNAAVGLANTHHALGELPQAERVLREAARRAPDSVIVLNNLAQTLSDQQRDAEALPVIERAAALGGPHAAAVDETRQAILGRLAAKRKN